MATIPSNVRPLSYHRSRSLIAHTAHNEDRVRGTDPSPEKSIPLTLHKGEPAISPHKPSNHEPQQQQQHQSMLHRAHVQRIGSPAPIPCFPAQNRSRTGNHTNPRLTTSQTMPSSTKKPPIMLRNPSMMVSPFGRV
jgi:hypothetical protein